MEKHKEFNSPNNGDRHLVADDRQNMAGTGAGIDTPLTRGCSLSDLIPGMMARHSDCPCEDGKCIYPECTCALPNGGQ